MTSRLVLFPSFHVWAEVGLSRVSTAGSEPPVWLVWPDGLCLHVVSDIHCFHQMSTAESVSPCILSFLATSDVSLMEWPRILTIWFLIFHLLRITNLKTAIKITNGQNMESFVLQRLRGLKALLKTSLEEVCTSTRRHRRMQGWKQPPTSQPAFHRPGKASR